MANDEIDLSAREERASRSLRAALDAEVEAFPMRLDVVRWIDSEAGRRRARRWVPAAMTAALAALLVAVGIGFVVRPGGLPAGPGSTATAGPWVPGTPGHYDDGQISFDYPTDWKILAGPGEWPWPKPVMNVLVVLGTGGWSESCQSGSEGTSSWFECGTDRVDLPPGGVVVKVYRWYGGPYVPCRGNSYANATPGDVGVFKTVNASGTVTMWEIRLPGNEFGQPNNIFVEVHSTDPAQLARAQQLVASLRFLNESGSFQCSPFPTPTIGGGPS